MIVAATPSVISRIVFFDKDLAESDIPFVESVIDPPFPAFSLNFLAILVRPSAVSLKLSRSCPNKSVWAFFGKVFSSTDVDDDDDDAVTTDVAAAADDDALDDIDDDIDDKKDDVAVVDSFSLFVS